MILVTGGTGFLGKRLVRKLVGPNGQRIRCLVRPGTSPEIFHPALADVPEVNLEMFPASFNDKAALKRALEGVDIVYHLAASKRGSAASMVANTVVGSDNLYRACVDERVSRFVLISSFGVMGVAKLSRGAIVDESVPIEEYPEQRDAYSFSKCLQEELAWEYFKCHELPLVVIRPGVIFGPGSEILSARVGLKLFGLFLHLGGSNLVPLTYVDNCADAIILAGTTPDIEGEVFCVVDDDIPTSRKILKRYRREVAPLRTIRIPYIFLKLLARFNVWYTNRTNGFLPAIFTPYKVASTWKSQRFTSQKAKKLLKWNPKIPMSDALNITYSSLAKSQTGGE